MFWSQGDAETKPRQKEIIHKYTKFRALLLYEKNAQLLYINLSSIK